MEPLARPAPTPGDLTIAHRPVMPAGRSAPYDRHAWEEAVLAGDLKNNARLVAFLLAHHADPEGHIPAGGPQHAELLAADTKLPGRFARMSLNVLHRAGYLTRPPIETWTAPEVRPITLTMPPAPAEPPHTGRPL